MNLLFNDENMNNIIDNSIYGQILLNNNTMNMTYLNNNNKTILNETNTNINNNILNNNIKENDINLNTNGDNNTNINEKSNNNNNIYLNYRSLNQTFYSQRYNPNVSSSFSPNKNNISNNFLNKTFSNTITQSNNINKVYPLHNINEESIRIDNNISIPQLPNDILNIFSNECNIKYNIIINFLIDESKNIMEELNIYNNNQKASNNKMNILRESGDLSKYNNILNRIYQEENNKSNKYFRNINYKSKVFEMIRKNCEDDFIFIQKYSNKNNIVINKLNQIINQIEEYNKTFNNINNNYSRYPFSMKNNYINNNENILNNTLNENIKENTSDNNNINAYENSFINNMRSNYSYYN